MINISKILRSYTPLGAYIFGIAILGYLGYHTVQWIIDKCAKTKQIDGVAQRTIISTSPQGLSPKNNHTTSKVLPFPKIIITSQDEETQVSKITLKQQSGDQKIPDVTKTQSVFRGHIVRLSLKQMQVEEKLEEKKSAAATKIQSVWKGYLARIKLKKHVVSYDLLLKAKPYVDYPSNRQDVPLASNGNTKVYLPKVLPIVLKQSGSPANRKRFHQMRQARDICEKNNYEHLVIPKARVYGEFIIESRLPISVDGTKEQIGFYIENRARFTDAVKEFTGFLCQSTFSDITGQTNDPYQVLFKTPIGRYDNVALYLKEDQGKIGLIDLEQFTPKFSKLRKDWCFQRCRNAVDLFPYHLDEIMNVAKRFDPHIEFYSRYLEL